MSDVLQTNIVYTKKYSYYKYRSFLQQLCYFLTIVIFSSYNNCCKNNNQAIREQIYVARVLGMHKTNIIGKRKNKAIIARIEIIFGKACEI